MSGERAPFGSWRSPITAASIVAGATTITEVVVDGHADDSPVWFAESRPAERGRTALLRIDETGAIREITPPGANVRSRVHEYGGGAWWVQHGTLVYVELADQQLRLVHTDGVDGPTGGASEPVMLTADARDRYADLRLSADGAWVLAVRERHDPAAPEPANELVAVRADGSGEVRVLVSGPDFVASPRLSPDGARLAWVQWFHPNMPWDSTELWVATFADGVIHGARCVARDAALVQPEWAPDGVLHVISDASGWWRIVRLDGAGGTERTSGARDWGRPPWVFGESTYAFRPDGSLVTLADVDAALTEVTCVRTRGANVVAAGATWATETQVVQIDPAGSVTQLRPPRGLGLEPGFFPPPEHLSFATGDGAVAHAWLYAPANPAYTEPTRARRPGDTEPTRARRPGDTEPTRARRPGDTGPEGERPPLIVMAHGGPTAAVPRALRLPVRFWTSRGFAVVEVDYRGSTGYGREYRQALDGQWGIADVEDCVAVARTLSQRGDVDPDRLCIRGGSAGGYTVLCALVFHDVFAVGASHYGIADLEALATDTHKFESRYLDRLVGPYPAARDVYVARSPIHHTERLATPTIVLQGLDDRVVPPNQAEVLVAALAAKHVPHAYVAFAGEGHGFRQAPNMIAALEAELSFYGQMLGFEPADPLTPVPVRR